MTTVLQTAVEHFSVAMEMEEKEWTLRATMRIGDLFMKMAEITGEEKIQTKNEYKIIGDKIMIKKGLPQLYDKARGLYQKNLDLAREQRIKSKWIDTTEIRYLETYYLKGRVFEEIGGLLASSPVPTHHPDGEPLLEEEIADYKAALKDKKYEMEQAAKPIYAVSLKAAQFYGINNEVKEQIKERLRYIDPEAPELELKELTREEREIVFVDKVYKANMKKINKIYEDGSMSENRKVAKLKEMEEVAKKEIERLLKELAQLKSGTPATANNSSE
jgi:hypothetical protein